MSEKQAKVTSLTSFFSLCRAALHHLKTSLTGKIPLLDEVQFILRRLPQQICAASIRMCIIGHFVQESVCLFREQNLVTFSDSPRCLATIIQSYFSSVGCRSAPERSNCKRFYHYSLVS